MSNNNSPTGWSDMEFDSPSSDNSLAFENPQTTDYAYDIVLNHVREHPTYIIHRMFAYSAPEAEIINFAVQNNVFENTEEDTLEVVFENAINWAYDNTNLTDDDDFDEGDLLDYLDDSVQHDFDDADYEVPDENIISIALYKNYFELYSIATSLTNLDHNPEYLISNLYTVFDKINEISQENRLNIARFICSNQNYGKKTLHFYVQYENGANQSILDINLIQLDKVINIAIYKIFVTYISNNNNLIPDQHLLHILLTQTANLGPHDINKLIKPIIILNSFTRFLDNPEIKNKLREIKPILYQLTANARRKANVANARRKANLENATHTENDENAENERIQAIEAFAAFDEAAANATNPQTVEMVTYLFYLKLTNMLDDLLIMHRKPYLTVVESINNEANDVNNEAGRSDEEQKRIKYLTNKEMTKEITSFLGGVSKKTTRKSKKTKKTKKRKLQKKKKTAKNIKK